MERQVARLVGGAGTGKTHRLMETLEKVLAAGVDPLDVGFVSFTRAARREAMERAAPLMHVPLRVLETQGWFRTLHAACYRLLGIDRHQMLSNTLEGRRWASEALGEPIGGIDGDLNDATPCFAAKTDADKALSIWATARCRMTSLRTAYEERAEIEYDLPGFVEIRTMIEKYEAAKGEEDRIDYTDLLSMFAGLRTTVDGVVPAAPMGVVPDVKVWFHDEMQDSSHLADAVFQRLIDHETVRWVYLAGDPYQSIYLFSGADPTCFMEAEVTKEEIMPQSYRCPGSILSLGERILQPCSDYRDRGIAPATHDGEIEECLLSDLCRYVDPRDDWLILARTNYLVRRLIRQLEQGPVPWKPVAGNGGWQETHKTKAMDTLYAMEQGKPIRIVDWISVVKTIQTKNRLMRGAKKFFLEELNATDAASMEDATAENYHLLAITEEYLEKIKAGQWKEDFPDAIQYLATKDQLGDLVHDPRVVVGTIHSVKGAEADNVAVLTTTTNKIVRSMSNEKEYDAEQRVWYVAATRARRKLLIVNELGTQKKGLPI